MFLRYISLVRAEGPREGSVQWVGEVRRRVKGVNPPAKAKPDDDTSALKEDNQEGLEVKEEPHDDARSDVSALDDATVIVGENSPDGRLSFKELDGRDSPVFVKREPEPGIMTVEVIEPIAQGRVVEAL